VTMTGQNQTTGNDSEQGQTTGEKLFLAHIDSYLNDDEDKGDHQQQLGNAEESKGRRMSVGEELWIVHCKRSEGVAFESDDANQNLHMKKAMLAGLGYSKKATDRVICLRNRNVKIA
jgi:hypothetical protein